MQTSNGTGLPRLRIGRQLEEFDLTWIEEPLDAYDAEGHAMLADKLDTPIATGEMLTSTAEHRLLIDRRSWTSSSPTRPGGRHYSVPADHGAGRRGRAEAGAALCDGDPPAPVRGVRAWTPGSSISSGWSPLFNERLRIADGRMRVPDRPGLGVLPQRRGSGPDRRDDHGGSVTVGQPIRRNARRN